MIRVGLKRKTSNAKTSVNEGVTGRWEITQLQKQGDSASEERGTIV